MLRLIVQTSLAAHAELVTTDRLLELVDQFAAAEGRMKWVPNKKLHFEVAIIKAIQSLGQATLDEVIERLSQLRDGKSVSQKQSPPVVAGVPPGICEARERHGCHYSSCSQRLRKYFAKQQTRAARGRNLTRRE